MLKPVGRGGGIRAQRRATPSIRDLGLSGAIEQGECAAFTSGKLVEPALPRRLVRPPAQQCGAVAEAAFAHVVIAHLDDELGAERLPFAGALGVPAAPTRPRAPRAAAGAAPPLGG